MMEAPASIEHRGGRNGAKKKGQFYAEKLAGRGDRDEIVRKFMEGFENLLHG
jgi:hypothetical protein